MAEKDSKYVSLPDRDPIFSGTIKRILQLIALFVPGSTNLRIWLHRMRGVKIGSPAFIGYGALIETAYPQLVTIGNNVEIGIRSTIIAHFKYDLNNSKNKKAPYVKIEDDVYIGPGVIILPNVTIGKGSVVSAGSIVFKSIPPQTMVQGNPAKQIARCNIPLSFNHSFEEFICNLRPIKNKKTD